jgi:hypothetical protein
MANEMPGKWRSRLGPVSAPPYPWHLIPLPHRDDSAWHKVTSSISEQSEDRDHSDCPVELRPCSEHKAGEERQMAEAMSCEKQIEAEPLCERQDAAPQHHCECGCSDTEPARVSAGACIAITFMRRTHRSFQIGTSPTAVLPHPRPRRKPRGQD